jgi:hypothetical protein
MAGVIDDFEEALNEILKAANLPVSVLVLKIGSILQENDTDTLKKLSGAAFRECERQFLEVLSYDNYKLNGVSSDGTLT